MTVFGAYGLDGGLDDLLGMILLVGLGLFPLNDFFGRLLGNLTSLF